jgi:hypothetical protein
LLRQFCVEEDSRRCPLERTAFFSCHVDHESHFLSPDLEQQVDRVVTSRLVREDDLLLLTEAVVQRRIRATNTSSRREVASQALSDGTVGSAQLRRLHPGAVSRQSLSLDQVAMATQAKCSSC